MNKYVGAITNNRYIGLVYNSVNWDETVRLARSGLDNRNIIMRELLAQLTRLQQETIVRGQVASPITVLTQQLPLITVNNPR